MNRKCALKVEPHCNFVVDAHGKYGRLSQAETMTRCQGLFGAACPSSIIRRSSGAGCWYARVQVPRFTSIHELRSDFGPHHNVLTHGRLLISRPRRDNEQKKTHSKP